jgi:hypothetical protein
MQTKCLIGAIIGVLACIALIFLAVWAIDCWVPWINLHWAQIGCQAVVGCCFLVLLGCFLYWSCQDHQNNKRAVEIDLGELDFDSKTRN